MFSGKVFAGKYSVVYVTAPSAEVGKTLAHGLVKNELAATVKIVPQITSFYQWQNEVVEDNESLLMIVTRTSQVDNLTNFVRVNHPYEVCEVTSLPIQNGKYSVVYVTAPSAEVGKTLAHGLVKNELAATVKIVPQITSFYQWQNEVVEDNESLLMIVTRTSQVDNLTNFVRVNHPYEVCEVTSLPIQNGNPMFLKWIEESVPANLCGRCEV